MTHQVLRDFALSIDRIGPIIARLPKVELGDDLPSDPAAPHAVLCQLSAFHRAELRRLSVILNDQVLSIVH